MKIIPAYILFIILFAACKQQPVKTGDSSNKIIIGTIDSVNSATLKEPRKIWVSVPASYTPGSKKKYPVVYLLDGDGHFLSVTGLIQQLSSVNGNDICPEMIVVGILNTNRTRDLTPTHVDVDPPYMDSASAKNSGGGEAFMDFIQKELMPHIDSAYPTSPYKVLIGHSFGGLTVMNTVMHRPGLFNAYVCIDPSMWWDKQKLLKEVADNLPAKQFKNTPLFLGIANTMLPQTMDTTKVQGDTTANNKHIRAILALSHYLVAEKPAGLRVAVKYYNTDNHSSVPLITEYDALHFLFNYYPFNLTDDDYMNISQAVIAKIQAHFDTVSTHMGYSVLPPEEMINQLAYQAISIKKYPEAETLAKLNTVNYPESANAYDTLGDVYKAEGNKPKAIECYKKALSIKEIPETKKKLEELDK